MTATQDLKVLSQHEDSGSLGGVFPDSNDGRKDGAGIGFLGYSRTVLVAGCCLSDFGGSCSSSGLGMGW